MRHDGVIHDARLITQAIELNSRKADAALDLLHAADRRLDVGQRAEVRRKTSDANTAELLAQGKRAILFAAAIVLVVLSVGYVAQKLLPLAAAARHDAAQALASGPPSGSIAPRLKGAPLAGYVIFSYAKRKIGGFEYTVRAGHRYKDANAAELIDAWCYTQEIAGGVTMSLVLGRMEPGRAPVRDHDPATRKAMGLEERQAAGLFHACPWKSGGMQASSAPPGRQVPS